jgi:DNA-binding transcriptional regulator LsrR (DeoR family)
MAQDSDELMLRAVWMYYHDNMTHAAIAQKLHTSRVKITRLLQKAREDGLVEISIREPLPITYELAGELERAFALKEAVVVRSSSTLEASLDAVGQASAEYLVSVVKAGCKLGFGWSTTVGRMAPYLKPTHQTVSCEICELAGSMLGRMHPYSISGKVAEILGAPLHSLAVPVVLQNKLARDTLLNETSIQAALAYARQSDIAFVGLGEATANSTMVTTGYLTAEDIEALKKRGAVGDILMRYFDVEGHQLPTPFDERVIALEWDDIHNIPHVVVIAAGPHKVEPILGILRSGLCQCLITDIDTAQAVLSRVMSG